MAELEDLIARRIKGGAPIPFLPDIDFRARAIDFHRRAQKAEAAAARAVQDAAYWKSAWRVLLGNRATVKRKLNRARAQLRAVRMADPLTRIIELGKQFP